MRSLKKKGFYYDGRREVKADGRGQTAEGDSTSVIPSSHDLDDTDKSSLLPSASCPLPC
jgi:hypothetical protein